MTDPLTWSPINLGRWSKTRVRVHFTLVVYVAYTLLNAAVTHPARLGPTACWLGLLLLALAVHELGHALAGWWIGADPEDVRLWPLGNMIGPQASSRAQDNVVVAIAGPIASAVMVVAAAVGLYFLNAQFVWNPFGNASDLGAPHLLGARAGQLAPSLSLAWWIGWFGYLNYVILLANLLPALPFDNGRVFRAYLAQASLTSSKDAMIAPILGRSIAIILFLGGTFRLLHKLDGLVLCFIGFLIWWIVRMESRLMEDGGYFDDGVFGYDFSEGYTSLESSAAKVRPYRESALNRWRRRRSDLRRQRRQLREDAEERRMDEILEKLHREGRPALTDEEHRFLVRVSVKYRSNKPRP